MINCHGYFLYSYEKILSKALSDERVTSLTKENMILQYIFLKGSESL